MKNSFSTYAVLASMTTLAMGFDLLQYSSSKCTGSSQSEKGVKPDRGCVQARPDAFDGLINTWTDEEDNDLVLALYSDESCCHANVVQIANWDESCIEIKESVRSFRAVDPKNPEGNGGYDECEKSLVDEEPLLTEGTPVTWD